MTNSGLLDSLDANSYYIEGADIADTKAPQVPIERRWEERRFRARLVNPANRRKLDVIIVGTGLAGSSAAATLGEAGYNVTCFCYQDSPRRAHSIAAQGGINGVEQFGVGHVHLTGLPIAIVHQLTNPNRMAKGGSRKPTVTTPATT